MAEQTIRGYYDLVDTRNLEGVLALFHPQIMYERGGQGAIHGIGELRNFFESGRLIREGRHELTTVLADGQHVAVRGQFSGTLHSGEAVTVRFADFHEFKDGLIWRRYSYFMDRFV